MFKTKIFTITLLTSGLFFSQNSVALSERYQKVIQEATNKKLQKLYEKKRNKISSSSKKLHNIYKQDLRDQEEDNQIDIKKYIIVAFNSFKLINNIEGYGNLISYNPQLFLKEENHNKLFEEVDVDFLFKNYKIIEEKIRKKTIKNLNKLFAKQIKFCIKKGSKKEECEEALHSFYRSINIDIKPDSEEV